MKALKTISNTQYELNIAKVNLDYLLDKKEKIYTKKRIFIQKNQICCIRRHPIRQYLFIGCRR